MTTLAKNTLWIFELGDYDDLPVIANDIIYEGAAIGAVDGTGLARPLEGADKFMGFCYAKADNTGGAASAINVRAAIRGAAKLSVSGAVVTDIGQPVYATDDDTFVFLPTGGSYIGRVARWVESGVVIVAFDAINGVDPYGDRGTRETIAAASKTLDVEDTGKIMFVTQDCTVTIPATAVGLKSVKLVCMGPFGTVQIVVDPQSADKILGPDLSGGDNANLTNTKATARRGDFVVLSNGHADGPAVEAIRGTWA